MTRWRGFTLVELVVTIVVSAILLALAIPSFRSAMDTRRLVGAADNLLADMRYAQAEAMKTNVPAVVSFSVGGNWSYTVNTTPGKNAYGTDYKGTSLAVSTTVTDAGDAITFDPRRNTIVPTPTAVEKMVVVTSEYGGVVALEVTPESAMRLCTTTGLAGYPACS